MIHTIRNRLLLGAIVCAVLLSVGYLALVNTTWGQAVDNAGYFGRHIVARAVIEYDNHILGAVSIATLALAVAIILLIGAIRRCLLGALIVAAGFTCAVVGAELLKRTLPWHALVPTDAHLTIDLQRETYPSGHTTIGTSLAIALILVISARWRPWVAVVAGFVSASFATGVLFAGWHRPSDALGGIVWSGLCMSMAAVAAVTLLGHAIRPIEDARRALIGSAVLAAFVAASTWFAAVAAPDAYPDADAPFLILSLLIILGSFLMTAWFGWQLRSLDWQQPRRT
ncbi:MAG TPA: phosphatase PAP2 family protein [Terrimicrobiaceae bacterium]